MTALTSASLNLPSLGLLLQEGGRICEAGSVQQDAAVVPELRSTPRAKATFVQLKDSGAGLPAPRNRRAFAMSNRRRKSKEDVQDLGIRHSTKLHTVEQSINEISRSGMQKRLSRAVNGDVDVRIQIAAEDDRARLEAACKAMAPYLARLKSGSLIMELGSRFGDLTLMISSRFPELYVQSTEGTGEACPAMFLLLQQRLGGPEGPEGNLPDGFHYASSRRSLASGRPTTGEKTPQPSGRVLAPRFIDGARPESWRQKLSNQDIHCIFAVNTIHYLAPARLRELMQGCWGATRVGGLLMFCGPFIHQGEARESVIVYDGQIKEFAAEQNGKAGRERDLSWSCHDTMLIESLGKKIGFELISVDEVPFTDWLLVVLRRLKLAVPDYLQGKVGPTVNNRKPGAGGRERERIKRRGSFWE